MTNPSSRPAAAGTPTLRLRLGEKGVLAGVAAETTVSATEGSPFSVRGVMSCTVDESSVATAFAMSAATSGFRFVALISTNIRSSGESARTDPASALALVCSPRSSTTGSRTAGVVARAAIDAMRFCVNVWPWTHSAVVSPRVGDTQTLAVAR